MLKKVLFFSIIFLFTQAVNAADFQLKPRKIIIPSLNIALPVKPAKVELDTWEVHLDAASYGETSVLPGNRGNTVIFSHALEPLFGKLPLIKTGDQIHVFTDHDWFIYRVEKTLIVKPDRVDLLKDQDKPTITLFTCIGPNYENRYVIQASLDKNTASFLQD